MYNVRNYCKLFLFRERHLIERREDMKSFFITQGTAEFLDKIMQEHKNENMFLFHDDFSSILLHETTGKSLFKEPSKYKVVESVGQLASEGLIILHYVPVTDEGRPVFEYQFKNQVSNIENESGLITLRLLRPQTGEPYVILSQWENDKQFNTVKNKLSNSFFNQQKTLYPRPSYVKKYYHYTDQ